MDQLHRISCVIQLCRRHLAQSSCGVCEGALLRPQPAPGQPFTPADVGADPLPNRDPLNGNPGRDRTRCQGGRSPLCSHCRCNVPGMACPVSRPECTSLSAGRSRQTRLFPEGTHPRSPWRHSLRRRRHCRPLDAKIGVTHLLGTADLLWRHQRGTYGNAANASVSESVSRNRGEPPRERRHSNNDNWSRKCHKRLRMFW